jgi:hypothetical protein
MHTIALAEFQRRTEPSSGIGSIGCFVFLLIIGLVIFLVMRGRKDKQEQLGASHRPLGSGPVDAQNFTSPYPKCGNCGAPGDKMKSNWDGMRKIAWTCGYCSAQAGVQELKDEELPASARQRLGLDAPGVAPGQPGYMPNQGGGMGGIGGGVGGLLTGMMIGGMMGGGGHHHNDGGSGQGSSGSGGSDWGNSGGSNSGGDWGDSSGSDSSGGGSDWGDSGGGDSGGGDSGGGDW